MNFDTNIHGSKKMNSIDSGDVETTFKKDITDKQFCFPHHHTVFILLN